MATHIHNHNDTDPPHEFTTAPTLGLAITFALVAVLMALVPIVLEAVHTYSHNGDGKTQTVIETSSGELGPIEYVTGEQRVNY